jgi:hypothetical protein
MGTYRPIVFFRPDPWVLILSRTQPVGPYRSTGPWEPAGSVAAYLLYIVKTCLLNILDILRIQKLNSI